MAGDNDEGGKTQRPLQAPATMLDVDDAARRRAAVGPDSVLYTPIAEISRRVVEQTKVWVPSMDLDIPGPVSAVSVNGVMKLAQELHAELLRSREKPNPTETMLFNQALFALMNAAIEMEPNDRLLIDALAANIGALGEARGFDLASPHPKSKVIETSQDPDARIAATQSAIVAIVDEISAQVADAVDTTAKERAIAASAPRLIALMRAMAPPRDRAKKNSGDLDALSNALDHLTQLARSNRLDMSTTNLDGVFDAENGLNSRFNLDPTNRRQKYYANVNASDLDDDEYDRDDSLPTGGVLVEQILNTYSTAPLRQTLALTTLSSVLTEPVKPKDPSLFGRVVEHIVTQLLETLSSTLAGHFSRAVQAIAANPRGAAAAVKRGVTDGAGGAYDVLPAPAQRGVDAVGRGVRRTGKAVKPAVDAIKGAVSLPPEALAKLERAGLGVLKASGAAAAIGGKLTSVGNEVVGAVGSERKPGAPSGSMVAQFISMLGSEIDAYALAVSDESPALRAHLETLSPGQLTLLRDAHRETIGDVYQVMRTSIAERWTTAVAAAAAGVDADGTTAHGEKPGTFAQTELPGVVQLRVRVDTFNGPMGLAAPKLTLLAAPVINGISESMKAVLAERPTPLHRAHIHRTMDVEFPSAVAGAMLSMGTIDFGPDGQVDLSRADLYNLSSIAKGEIPNRPYGELEGMAVTATGRANAADAERAARMLLEGLGLSTADIH